MSPVAILDLIEGDLDSGWSQEEPKKQPAAEDDELEREIRALALQEFKDSKKPDEGLEALRVLLNLMK